MSDFVPSKANWVSPIKKGSTNKKVLMDTLGYRLHYKKKDNRKKYYHCSHKDDLQCPVKVTLDIASDMITGVRGEHNHDNMLMESEVRKIIKANVLQASQNPTVTSRTVLKDISSSVLSSTSAAAGLPYVPSSKAMAATLQRVRKKEKNYPPIPHKWVDMMIPGSLSVTADGQNYCVMDEKIPGKEEMIWGFASKTGIDVMKKSSDWYVDGTFELVNSTLFKQVWVIVCPINENNTSIPCAFFLLPSKEFQVYKMVLDCLKGFGINGPQKIHMDFEGGPIKAVKAVYPTTKINSCDFHWKQCLVRQLQKLGLMKSYNSHLEVQKFVRYLWCLSLTPPEHVVSAWEGFVANNIPEVEEDDLADEEERAAAVGFNIAMGQFALYFENTWLGSKNNRNPELPRRQPKFPITLWNKNKETMAGDETTNNRSENWNSVSKLGMSMHPSLWSVLELFQKEDALARAKLNSVALGTPSIDHPARKKKAAEKKEKLKKVLELWGTVSVEDYFNMVAAHYNDN